MKNLMLHPYVTLTKTGIMGNEKCNVRVYSCVVVLKCQNCCLMPNSVSPNNIQWNKIL